MESNPPKFDEDGDSVMEPTYSEGCDQTYENPELDSNWGLDEDN
jgi:hypothetical protein